MRSMRPWKKGHRVYMSRSSASPPASMRALSAAPPPSQTGRWRRVWVHAKTHGMARSVSIPPAALRFAGRDPRFISASADVGVAAWKYLRGAREEEEHERRRSM
eukprot:6766578-Prymnesium_polylepis.1